MATAEIEYDSGVFTAQQRKQDEQLLVRFFKTPIQNDVKTEKEGRPMFDDTDMIEIRVRGQKDNVVIRPIRDDDKKRFRDAWRDHEDGAKSVNSGTPLSQWPMMSSAQVEELKFLGFYTVEQLAGANDNSLPIVLLLKNKAKTYLEYAKGAAPLEQLQNELAAARNREETMVRQIAEMVPADAVAAAGLVAAGSQTAAKTR